MPKFDKTSPDINTKLIENQENTVIPNPTDEFPITSEVYCKIKHLNPFQTKIFLKVVSIEARYKKFFIKDWDAKYSEFFSRTV